MIDPIMVAVATALATKAAEGLSEAGRAAFGKLARRIRGRLDAEPDGARALETAQRHPEEPRSVERLAAVLAETVERDPAFGAEVVRLWSAVRADRIAATEGGNVNHISGTVGGAVVQARDVGGGIAFGAVAGQDARGER